MKTITLLNRLRTIDTNELSKVMNIRPNMARKYKKEPWKYDPPTSKAIEVELSFGIPVHFWKDIKSYSTESITSTINNKQLLAKKETE
jgi:hypothetical protein